MPDTGTPGWEQVEVGGEGFEWRIQEGFVQVRLPFQVDLEKLARHLKEEGYFLSEGAEETGAQGWGPDFDEEDYYPYWVLPDDEQPDWTLFTYPPEDYEQGEGTAREGAEREGAGRVGAEGPGIALPEFKPYLGTLAREELTRWLGHLKQARS